MTVAEALTSWIFRLLRLAHSFLSRPLPLPLTSWSLLQLPPISLASQVLLRFRLLPLLWNIVTPAKLLYPLHPLTLASRCREKLVPLLLPILTKPTKLLHLIHLLTFASWRREKPVLLLASHSWSRTNSTTISFFLPGFQHGRFNVLYSSLNLFLLFLWCCYNWVLPLAVTRCNNFGFYQLLLCRCVGEKY